MTAADYGIFQRVHFPQNMGFGRLAMFSSPWRLVGIYAAFYGKVLGDTF